MRKLRTLLILIFLSIHVIEAQTIEVDVGNVVKDFDYRPLGLNLNYLVDDDTYLNPDIRLSSSLNSMKVGMLRYPGGEKSDNYLWSVSPYNSSNPHFATSGNCNWPNSDARFSNNFTTPLSSTMDFDEFMVISNSIGATPLIVVAADAHHNSFCDNPPSLQDLITNAVEWVRYANVEKGYNIKYWMIGNESWNSAAYDEPSTATEYANDFIQFATAMKAIDSSISIVANSQEGQWAETLVDLASEHVDIIAISNYPVYQWNDGYDRYLNGNPSFIQNIESIRNTIGEKDIGIIVSEYNAIDWSAAWPSNNDLGRALVNFQMFGDQIRIPEVEGAFFWNSRWVDNDTSPQSLFDAIDANGQLNASGKALSLWGNHFLDKLVQSSNSGTINSFATVDHTANELNIFLINKDYREKEVNVNISNFPHLFLDSLAISELVFTGNSIDDQFPTIDTPEDHLIFENSELRV